MPTKEEIEAERIRKVEERKQRQREESARAKEEAVLKRQREGKLSRKDAQELADIRAAKAGIPTRDIRAPETSEEIAQAELIKGKAGFGAELEQVGAFEEITPKKTELSPDLKTDVPVITPTLGAASQIFGEAITRDQPVLGWAKDRDLLGDFLPKVVTGEEAFPIPETPETLREAALRQISINEFNKGTTEAEKFGAALELLPGFGFIDKWVEGVVEAPFGNAEDVIAQIEELATQATNNQEKTNSGIMPSSFALVRVRQMENDVARLKGKLKLYVNESKILQANTEQVNRWEESILDAEIRIDNFRTAASFASTADITGTRVVPTDEQLFFELKGGK